MDPFKNLILSFFLVFLFSNCDSSGVVSHYVDAGFLSKPTLDLVKTKNKSPQGLTGEAPNIPSPIGSSLVWRINRRESLADPSGQFLHPQ